MLKRIDIAKLLKRLIVLGLLGAIISLFVANKIVKRYGYDGLLDFVQNYSDNKALAAEADPVEMNIDISKTDYAFLEEKRQEALERGVQINIGDNYVPCEIEADGEKIIGEIRLKGHMTDHLQGKKWSFRVKSDDSILGMYRFSLQHPGTRNYAYEWVYHQLLKQEDVIHLNYDFVKLKLRDDDLGIYAMEEHFGQHVLEHNDRPAGAILRWNPNLYWEWRIDELDGIYLDEEYSAYTSSFPEPYDKGIVRADSNLVKTYVKGASQLEAFRRGEKTASEVFDVERMARFHAIIDLVGGYHSLDWSDVKFFYNSETGLIEPVGYESFSVRKTEKIAGQRVPDSYHGVADNYHDQLFADPVFFAAYIENLERICDEDYFNDFITSIQSELDKKLAILAMEWPHRQFTFDPYFENISLIKHNIELPKPFHAFYEGYKYGDLTLSLAPVTDFPVELLEVEIDGEKTIEFDNIILPPKARGDFINYRYVHLPCESMEFKNMVIKARIPGSSTKFKVEVNEFPSFEFEKDIYKGVGEELSIEEHPDIVMDVQGIMSTVYSFNSMDVIVDHHYVINQGELRLRPGQKIHFKENGFIEINYGYLSGYGTEDHLISLSSNQECVMFELNYTKSSLSNCQFVGGVYGMETYDTEMSFESCVFADFDMSFLRSTFSEVDVKNCQAGRLNTFGNFNRSKVVMNDVKANNGEVFLIGHSSKFELTACQINQHSKGFDLNQISQVQMWVTNFDEVECIAELEQSSELMTYGGDLGNASKGFKIDEEGEMGIASTYTLYGTNSEGVGTLEE